MFTTIFCVMIDNDVIQAVCVYMCVAMLIALAIASYIAILCTFVCMFKYEAIVQKNSRIVKALHAWNVLYS